MSPINEVPTGADTPEVSKPPIRKVSVREAALRGIKFRAARESGYVAIAATVLSLISSGAFATRIAVSLNDPRHQGIADLLFEMETFGLVALLLAMVAFFCIVGWQYAVHKNVAALGNPDGQWPPTWSIWSWMVGPILFVGVVVLHWALGRPYDPRYRGDWSAPWVLVAILTGLPSVVLPFFVLQYVFFGSDPQRLKPGTRATTPNVLIAWWIGSALAYTLEAANALNGIASRGLVVIAVIVTTANSVLVILFILRLNSMQLARNTILRSMRQEAENSATRPVESVQSSDDVASRSVSDDFPFVPPNSISGDSNGPIPTPWLDS